MRRHAQLASTLAALGACLGCPEIADLEDPLAMLHASDGVRWRAADWCAANVEEQVAHTQARLVFEGGFGGRGRGGVRCEM